jgi:RimJ/RimL family protein N-acetyltransferase
LLALIAAVSRNNVIGYKGRIRRRELGTTALRLLIEYLFSERNVDKIRLDTNLKNNRAQHVYENKIGFYKVKVHVDTWRDQLGELQSFVEYELSRKNYLALPN